MSAIRGHGNKTTELRLARLLRRHQCWGWRRHPQLPGKPDFVFRQEMLAVFVDGCFWHGCRWHAQQPSSNIEYWEKKIMRNKLRDRQVTHALELAGWKVLRIWEHSFDDSDKVMMRLKEALHRT